MKSMQITATCLLLTIVSSAMAEDLTNSNTSNTKVTQGLEVTNEKSNSVQVEKDVSVKSETNLSTTVDPKGMSNKVTASKKRTRVDHKNGDYKDSTTVIHADGTVEKDTVERNTSKNLMDNGKTVSTSSSRVVDPKGLGNKESEEIIDKVDTNPDGTQERTVSEKSN